MNLLLDIGNSRLKWAAEHRGAMLEPQSRDYRLPGYLTELERAWRDIGVPCNVAIASVSDRLVLDSLIGLCRSLWPDCRLFVPRASRSAFGVHNAYRQPEKLGIDRWLAIIAAHNLYAGDVCVIDCGTAVTVDAVRADGRHLGGLICPGLNLMTRALVSNTADLSFAERDYSGGLGTATEAAIANGVFSAVTGLIENAMHKLDAGYRPLLTGGDAARIAPALSVPCLLDQSLVLKGLSLVCRGETKP